MPGSFPSPSVVLNAIAIYLKHAYTHAPPATVRGRLETLAMQPAETFYECPVLESDAHVPPTRYSIRLGNRNYPHMKLAVQQSPDGGSAFFKADTHDSHCCPGPSSPEYKMFLGLMESNEAIAKQIEAAWAEAGIPTFREYLREDLARRVAAARGG
jgi:hypothetical protein